MIILEFDKIKKSFPGKRVLDDLSLNVNEGEIYGLVGRSGCGKSTLLKMLIGMVNPDSGKIKLFDKNIRGNKNFVRKQIGYVSQENMIIDELSVEENCLYYARLYGVSRKSFKERFNQLSELLGLSEHRRVLVKNLSGGMAKRVNIMVSLMHDPKILILDEPTVGLDSLLRESIWGYIKKINSAGTTIIVTSHLLDEIEENCDKIAIIDKGTVVTTGTIKEYKEYFKKSDNEEISFGEIFKIIIKR